MTREFKIEGMSCGHCRAHVEKALNAIPGVRANVTLDPPIAKVEFTGTEKPVSELQRAVSEAGYTLTE